MTFQDCIKTYLQKDSVYETEKDRLRKRQEELRGQLERIENRISKHYSKCPSWVDEIIEPIAKEMTEYLEAETYHIYGPFGLTANTHIHFYVNGEPVGYLDFRPTDLIKGVLSVGDYANYTPDHVKDPNLFRTPLVEVPQAANCAWFRQFVVTD